MTTLAAVEGYTFLADVVTTPEVFEALPVISADPAALVAAPRGIYRARLCRDAGSGASWHAVGVTHYNGAERPLASRILLGQQHREG